MREYLDLLRLVRDHGTPRPQRARLADGSRPATRGVFGHQLRFDLDAGFPLVTTKRVPFRWVVEELLWFLSGSTNNRDLRARGVTIWDEWADPATGDLGPIYGKQWRAWEAPDGRRIDQLRDVLEGIRAVARDPEDPRGRRLLVTAWNPADLARMKGPPACHTLYHFQVLDGALSCHLFQRSADLFLGVPFNIASYALLTSLLAKLAGLRPGTLVHTLSDAHLYANHLPAVAEQLTRVPRPRPRLTIADDARDLDGLLAAHFQLEGYDPWPALRGEVAV